MQLETRKYLWDALTAVDLIVDDQVVWGVLSTRLPVFRVAVKGLLGGA